MKGWTDEKIEKCIMAIANKFDPARMPTNREVIEMSGTYALSNAIQKNGGIDIVRCKECKHAHMTYGGDCKYCDMWKDDDDFCIELYLDGDFYCAYGERKDHE